MPVSMNWGSSLGSTLGPLMWKRQNRQVRLRVLHVRGRNFSGPMRLVTGPSAFIALADISLLSLSAMPATPQLPFKRPQIPSNRDSLDNQVAGNTRPQYPKVDHYWFKLAHNYEPLALQVETTRPLTEVHRGYWYSSLNLRPDRRTARPLSRHQP